MAKNENARPEASTPAGRTNRNGSCQQAISQADFIMSSIIASSSTVSSRRSAEGCLMRFYPLPNPWDSLEQWKMFCHQDLDAMDKASLHRELRMLNMRLNWEDRPCNWLFWRRTELEQAIMRDENDTPPDSSAIPKRRPKISRRTRRHGPYRLLGEQL